MKKFKDYFKEVIAFPESKIIDEGIKDNTLYTFVLSDLLNGFIKYTDKIIAIGMINRYNDGNHIWEQQCNNFNKAISNKINCDLQGLRFNDIAILAETEKAYIYFYTDRDTSDCQIGKIKKECVKDKKELLESFRETLKNGLTLKLEDRKYIEAKEILNDMYILL